MYQFWVNRDPRAFNSRKEYVHEEGVLCVLCVLRGAAQYAVRSAQCVVSIGIGHGQWQYSSRVPVAVAVQ